MIQNALLVLFYSLNDIVLQKQNEYHKFSFYQPSLLMYQFFPLLLGSILEHSLIQMDWQMLLGSIFLGLHYLGLQYCFLMLLLLFYNQMNIFQNVCKLVFLLGNTMDLVYYRMFHLRILVQFQFLVLNIYFFEISRLQLDHLRKVHFHRNRILVFILDSLLHFPLTTLEPFRTSLHSFHEVMLVQENSFQYFQF